MLSYDELCKLVTSIHERFTYISDIAQYGKAEHWESFNEIPDAGELHGDCEFFAQAVRKELHKMGESSRLAVCGVNSNTINHAVCIYDNWVIDNIHRWPMIKRDLLNYKWFKISGYETGEAWREIV